MAIFQYWVVKTGAWEEVASKALNFYLNAVKMAARAGPFLHVSHPAEVCVFYCDSMHQ